MEGSIAPARKNHGTRITCHIPYLTGEEKQVKPDDPTPPLHSSGNKKS